MATLSVRLAESLLRSLREIAKDDRVSINQFISTAVAEKISAMQTAEFFERRLAKVNPETAAEDWARLMEQVPDVEPEVYDRLPSSFEAH